MTVHDNAVPEINCVEFIRHVDDLVDSDPGQWGPIVAKHLDDCPRCVIYLHQMLDLKVVLSHVFEGEKLSDEDVADVISAIHNFKGGR